MSRRAKRAPEPLYQAFLADEETSGIIASQGWERAQLEAEYENAVLAYKRAFYVEDETITSKIELLIAEVAMNRAGKRVGK